jgi:glycerol-3-phosphate dehydrogenase
MGVKIVNLVNNKINKKYNKKYGNSKTLKIPLCGNGFKNYRDVTIYINKISDLLKKLDLSSEYASYLVHNYGIQTDIILEKLSGSKSKNMELDLIMSELDHCIGFEMIYTPLDFIERRTGRLYFLSDSIEKYASDILNEFKSRFKWSDLKYEEEKNIFFNKFHQIRNFSD